MYNKKGVSPYIAYILLIAMSISIATFGIRYITNYSMQKADDVQNIVVNYLNCDDTDIKITNICQDESFIYFTAENSGYSDIKGIFVNIYYIDSKTSNYIERTMLLPMEKWNYKVLKLDMISGLDISPMIGNINNKNVCSNRIYKFNDIMYCK